jgi:hypothetical protein
MDPTTAALRQNKLEQREFNGQPALYCVEVDFRDFKTFCFDCAVRRVRQWQQSLSVDKIVERLNHWATIYVHNVSEWLEKSIPCCDQCKTSCMINPCGSNEIPSFTEESLLEAALGEKYIKFKSKRRLSL